MPSNPFSPHGSSGPLVRSTRLFCSGCIGSDDLQRSNAALLSILGVGGGLLYWLRFRPLHRQDLSTGGSIEHEERVKRAQMTEKRS